MQPPITNHPFIVLSPKVLKGNVHSVIKEMYSILVTKNKSLYSLDNYVFHRKEWLYKWKRKNQFLKNIWKEGIF